MSIFDNLFGEATGLDVDETIANSSISAAASSASAYLNAALISTTPEVRRLFQEYLSQSLTAHEGLTALAIKKGWVHPYKDPTEQLRFSYEQSKTAIGEKQQEM